MTYKQRAITVRFKLGPGEGFLPDGVSDTVDLTGYRAEVIVDNPGGGLAVGMLHMRIFGLPLAVMNTFATNGLHALVVRKGTVTVSAGDVGGRIQQVFSGSLLSAYTDFSAQPEASFNVTAQAGFRFKIEPAAPNVSDGRVDVAAKIEALARSIGYGFTNNGVSVHLNDQYLPGTIMDQMRRLADAAQVAMCVENDVVSIWPADGNRDNNIAEIGPTTGLVGYPTFTDTGISIKAEFNPEVILGSRIKVTSSIANANGEWRTQSVRHELSTLMEGGPWFSTARLTFNGLFVR